MYFLWGIVQNNLNPAAKVGAGTMNFIHQVKANSRIGFLKGVSHRIYTNNGCKVHMTSGQGMTLRS